MRLINYLTVTLLIAGTSTLLVDNAAAEMPKDTQYWQPLDSAEKEPYIEELVPSGIQVVISSLDGPVYADENGMTLYKWPLGALRNGSTGDRKDGPSNCTDEVLLYSAGLMSPYPPGLLLPDAENRLSCTQAWPPLIAPEGAEDVGKWTLTEREDGDFQWAYDGFPVYTSNLDQKPGDALGGTKIRSGGDGGIVREPIGPPSDIPSGFKVLSSSTGRLLVNDKDRSIYMWDGDGPNKSNCDQGCLNNWTPVPAPEIAVDRGEWTVVKQSTGFNQWAFRGKPLYTSNLEVKSRSFVGADVPGWHNVYMQRAVTPPAEFTVQDAAFGGQVLADANGRTIYMYNCRDDSLVQLACDHPAAPQDYRLAICGNGDPALCRQTFPYVETSADAKSESPLWSVLAIDPDTGHLASPDQDNTMYVWAYRARPVYTYGGDKEAGVTNGDGVGEFTGRRNGFKAFVLRDDFGGNAFRR